MASGMVRKCLLFFIFLTLIVLLSVSVESQETVSIPKAVIVDAGFISTNVKEGGSTKLKVTLRNDGPSGSVKISAAVPNLIIVGDTISFDANEQKTVRLGVSAQAVGSTITVSGKVYVTCGFCETQEAPVSITIEDVPLNTPPPTTHPPQKATLTGSGIWISTPILLVALLIIGVIVAYKILRK